MCFNSDLLKQAQEVVFRRKVNKAVHLLLAFSNSNVTQIHFQEQLGMIIDSGLTFNEYLEDMFKKSDKGISM